MATLDITLAGASRRQYAVVREHDDGRRFGALDVNGAEASFPLPSTPGARAGITHQPVVRIHSDNHGGECLLRFQPDLGSFDVTLRLSGHDARLLADLILKTLGGA